jgi:Ribosomal protein L24e
MKCEHCGKEHSRMRFCSNKCKDRWHNKHNPRGIATVKALTDEDKRLLNDEMNDVGRDDIESGWDGHKDAF